MILPLSKNLAGTLRNSSFGGNCCRGVVDALAAETEAARVLLPSLTALETLIVQQMRAILSHQNPLQPLWTPFKLAEGVQEEYLAPPWLPAGQAIQSIFQVE